MPDPARELPENIREKARAKLEEVLDGRLWEHTELGKKLWNGMAAALLAECDRATQVENERCAKIAIENGGEWLELAQEIAAAIRADHSGRR